MKTITHFKSVESFSTERLDAFKIKDKDFKKLVALHRETSVMATLGGVLTPAQSQKYLEKNLTHWQDNGFGLWIFYLKNSQDWIGRGGLRRLQVAGSNEIEVAFALMPQFWHQGFATEIAKACVEIAFDVLRLNSIVCLTEKTNLASQKVIKKAGFKYEKDFDYQGTIHVLYRLIS